MKKLTVVPIVLFLLFASVSVVIGNFKVYASELNTGSSDQVQLLWTNSMWVYDVAVSKGGNYIATVNDTGLHYFASDSSNPQWWYTPAGETFVSVRLSHGGEYVVAGDRNGHIVYFNSSTSRTGEQISPTWSSVSMGGAVERNTLDMSDDGNYVTLGGTGVNFYYFSNCTTRSETSEYATWSRYLGVYDFYAVRISPDGTCVAAGGSRYNGGFLAFYKNANTEPYPTTPAWYAYNSIGGYINDIDISDDAYAVVAVDETNRTLHYWANATNLTGDPNATWTYNGSFDAVCTNANGSIVIAGGALTPGLFLWTNATQLEGVVSPDWSRLNSAQVLDVATDSEGSLILASTVDSVNITDFRAHFFHADASEADEFNLLQRSPFVSMSSNGNVSAVAGSGFDSIYVFIPEFPSTTAVMVCMLVAAALIIRFRRKALTDGAK